MSNEVNEDEYEIEVENDVVDVDAENEAECPICQETISITSLIDHVMNSHPSSFLLWASYSLPWMIHVEEDDEALFNDYTYMTNLCDSIGYHKVGIPPSDIEIIAPITHSKSQSHAMNDKCPICMEELFNEDAAEARITVKCRHGFCVTCIESWFKENKTCPICMQWLAQEEPIPVPIPSSSLEEVD